MSRLRGVSTVDQDLTAQLDEFITLGVDPKRIYVDDGLTGNNRATDPACAKPSRPAAAATPWSSQATAPPPDPTVQSSPGQEQSGQNRVSVARSGR